MMLANSERTSSSACAPAVSAFCASSVQSASLYEHMMLAMSTLVGKSRRSSAMLVSQ